MPALVSAENSAIFLFPGNWRCSVSTTKPSLSSPTASFRDVGTTAKGHHQYLLNGRLSAGSLCQRLLRNLTTFSLSLEHELRGTGVSVVTVCPGRLRKTQNGGSDQARAKWAGIYQSPEEVVDDALRAFANGGGLTVPGALNKVSVFAQRLIPRRVVPRLVAKMSKA